MFAIFISGWLSPLLDDGRLLSAAALGDFRLVWIDEKPVRVGSAARLVKLREE